MRESRLRLLILHAHYTSRLSYYDDWLDALSVAPEFSVTAVDIVPASAANDIKRALAEVDAVILLHSTNGDTSAYLNEHIPLLADRRVPLLSFVGNELNLPGSPISEKRAIFSAIRPEWIATQLLQEAGQFLFGNLASRGVVSVPHALNENVFRASRPQDQRPIDVGVRLARYIPHLGDNDRNRIADRFRSLGEAGRLKVDISDQRYDRAGWADFLNHCKGTIATEAGSWFLERDDATVDAIRAYVRDHSRGVVIPVDSPLRTLGHKLPSALRVLLRRVLGAGLLRHEAMLNEQAPHDEIYQKFFSGRPRPQFYGKSISSRHFDAIGTKTCQIMFRGRFNDILEADRHYLALDDNFANLDVVLMRFADPAERQRIVEEAHGHIMQSHTYAHRIRQLHALLSGSSG